MSKTIKLSGNNTLTEKSVIAFFINCPENKSLIQGFLEKYIDHSFNLTLVTYNTAYSFNSPSLDFLKNCNCSRFVETITKSIDFEEIDYDQLSDKLTHECKSLDFRKEFDFLKHSSDSEINDFKQDVLNACELPNVENEWDYQKWTDSSIELTGISPIDIFGYDLLFDERPYKVKDIHQKFYDDYHHLIIEALEYYYR